MSKQETNMEKLLEDIKRLLVLQLYTNGVTTNEIGSILSVSYKTIERMLPRINKKRKS